MLLFAEIADRGDLLHTKDTTAQHLTVHNFVLCECGAGVCMLCSNIPGIQRHSGSSMVPCKWKRSESGAHA